MSEQKRTNLPRIGRVSSEGIRCIRAIVNGVEGWGKTTLAAHSPEPVIIQCRGETGYETLRSAGLVPDVDCVRVENWAELIAVADHLASTKHRTVALDALGGAERLCHQFVCDRDFGGVWGEKGFGAFQRGYEISLADWQGLLERLERLYRDGRNILILSHARLRTVCNPLGADYERYEGDCHKKTWAMTSRWVDAVWFCTFATVVTDVVAQKGKASGKGKGIGGTERIVFTERCDAYDAKNRYGQPQQISLNGIGPDGMWAALWKTIEKPQKNECIEMPEL